MAYEEPVRVLVTGAAGQIEPIDLIARAYMATHRRVILHLHLRSKESADEALNGARNKFGYLFEDVVTTSDVVEACTGVNLAVVNVGFSTKKGTEAKDFMPIYESLVLALGKHAAADCKVLAVGDPANTRELFSESSIPAKNITCLVRLDHCLANSERLDGLASGVENAMSFATVKTPYWEKSVHELVADDAWMNGEFPSKASKRSSAMSAASRDRETLVFMGDYFDGSHSVPAGRNGTWLIAEDLGTQTPAIFQSEVEGKIKQPGVSPEMISYQLTELENRAGAALHHYSSRIDEFDRHADHAFENLCNKIEFLQRETANLQSNLAIARVEIANLRSNLAIALVYLHGAFQATAMGHQPY